MDSNYLAAPLIFLIDTLFSLYIFAVLLRFLLQWLEADFYNPISQFLVKLTHPPLRILRRFLPSIGRIDTASVVLLLSLQMLSGYLVFLIQGVSANPLMLVVWSIAQLIELFMNVFIFAIVIGALMSWVGTGRNHNPAASLLYFLTQPMLKKIRRMMPPMGGVDLSPLIALIGLQVAKMLIIAPLQQLAASLS
jgi:YggT family protein